jgi:hypothetical protein
MRAARAGATRRASEISAATKRISMVGWNRNEPK